MKSFLILLIPLVAGNYNILEILESNIDDNIDPCDDFYRHVCAKNRKDVPTWLDYMEGEYAKELEKLARESVSGELIELYKAIERLGSQGLSDGFEKRLSKLYFEKCESNKTEAYEFLRTLERLFDIKENGECYGFYCFSNLALDSNCSRAAKTLKRGVLLPTYVMYLKKSYHFGNVSKVWKNGLSSLWVVKHRDEVKQIVDMFQFFKKELLNEIEKTPWLLNSNTMEIFKNITSQMRISLPEEKIEKTIVNIKNAKIKYDECLNNFKILGEDYLSEACIILAVPEIEDYNLAMVNAQNAHPYVIIHNTFLALLADKGSIALKYGTVGSALAHEMGHSIIVRDLTDGFYPYYSEKINPCIQNQFNKTCSIYKEADCVVTDKQLDDNGSDVFGFPFAFERLKQIMGDEVYQKIPESTRDLTHAKAFFHLVYGIGCRRNDVAPIIGDIFHGTNNIRINAGVIQSPEFEKSFQLLEK
ncbi:unnamed protein product [Caenorhabditis angaria]|uniref:Peptidase M13 C-terminal domain-containing protein n=1 Tax=Caenorhabditis angaria TaxID=860376 RepID=A0A9P1J1R4_9PELO|nr:unnamed protein product [Caenorhabditis angaria]